MTVTASVIVVTCDRPENIRRCLTHLIALQTLPLEIIVVDSSRDDETACIVRDEFASVQLLRNELGKGTTAGSRQIGLAIARGDVVAFVDDTVSVDPNWLNELVKPYTDPRVAAVGGRTLDGIDGEEGAGIGDIGRLLPYGGLSYNFAADSGRPIEVDHLLGANMSFQRRAIEAVGGIRHDYVGTQPLREEVDISLRLARRGGVLMFAPKALVHRIAPPNGTGSEKVDHHSLYSARRNHVMMLVRVFGWRDPMVRYYALRTIQDQRQHFWVARSHLRPRKLDGTVRSWRTRTRAVLPLTRAVSELAGLLAGLPAAIVATRHDAAANRMARRKASRTSIALSRGRAR